MPLAHDDLVNRAVMAVPFEPGIAVELACGIEPRIAA